MKRRTTEITIELESLVELRWSVTRNTGRCAQCQKVVTLVSPQEGGNIDEQHLNALLLLLDGLVHIVASEDGTPRICFQSLLRYQGGKRNKHKI